MANKLPSTQEHLDIEDIRDGLAILKNGNVAMLLETNALNFELLSEPEQDARILAFANLLNSLNFVIQIVIRTERADVNDYIEKLVKQRDQHISTALRKQMEIYIKFIQNLTVKTEILNKRFFIVATSNFTALTGNKSLVDSMLGKKSSVNVYANLERAKTYLYPKRDFLIKQFKKMGINSRQLTNDEIIQLFYDIYDPDKVGIKRVDIKEAEYTSGMVSPLTSGIAADLLNDIPKPGQTQTNGTI